MGEPSGPVLAAAAGVALGAIFFGGLWWTIRRGLTARRPAIHFVGSSLARMAIVLAGFFLVSSGDWKKLIACLVGFLAARIFVSRRVRASARETVVPKAEVSDAS
jgi:F1F0 ATPase subunit 2